MLFDIVRIQTILKWHAIKAFESDSLNQLIDFLIEPYKTACIVHIVLEFVAMAAGILSVYFAKKENILVYPIGIVSTAIYVYLLSQWQLYGDLIINIYYTLMSLYGWWFWSRIIDEETQEHIPITRMNRRNYLSTAGIFIFTSLFVFTVYRYYEVIPNSRGLRDTLTYVYTHITSGNLDQLREVMPYVDTFTTGAAFSAMWLMANKKLESWFMWIVVNVASVPLYFIKGFGFTGIQYTVFLILAIQGHYEWKRRMKVS